MAGAYLYPALVEPILPQVAAVAPANLANWYDGAAPRIIQPPSRFPAIEELYTLAYVVAKNDITFPGVAETPVCVGKPGAYYYEMQARPILPQPTVATAPTNVAVINPQPNFIPKPTDMSGALLNAMRSIAGLTGTVPISQYHWLDQVPQFIPAKSPVAALLASLAAAGNIAPITVAPFVSSVASWFAQQFPTILKPHQVAQQANIESFTSNTFPLPFVPTGVLMSDWWMDNYPWVPPARRFDLAAIAGSYTPLETFANPVLVEAFGWRIEPLFINRYPSQVANIETFYSYTPTPPEQIQQPLSFLVPSFDVWPKFRPANIQALLALYGHVSNTLPIPFVPAVAVPAPIFQDPPTQQERKPLDIVAVILMAVGGREQGLGSVQGIFQYGWPNYPAYPVFGVSATVATLYQVGISRNVAPITIAPFVASVAGFYTEWFPQWQPRSMAANIAQLVSNSIPQLPTPFIPAPAPSVSAYNLDVFPQLLSTGRFTYLIPSNGQVSPYLPIPFIPPPPSPCTQVPTGVDPETMISIFGGPFKPVSTLFCLTCKSGLPLLVRGDYAIWCQTCCRFVSKQETMMITRNAPKPFRGTF